MKKKHILIILLLLGISLFSYSFFIEVNWIEVTHHQIRLSPLSSKHLKIVQISDLHTTGIHSLEQKVISITKEEKPDLIIITGDIATPGGTRAGYENVLKNFSAPLGVYYVPGNWEDWEPITDLQNILQRNQITDLTNKAKRLDKNLWLVGFADSPTGNPDLKIIETLPKNSRIISIFHSPIFINEVKNKVDYAFVGHTHGGQIRFPFIGPIALPPGSDDFDQGWFEAGRTKMYVSRGIGTSILPFRFLCRPEISVFELFF